jgi:hypothetical protein
VSALTLDQLIIDVEDRIDTAVASAVMLETAFQPFDQTPQLLKDHGVAIVPPWEVENTGGLRDRYVQMSLFRLTINAAVHLPATPADRKTVRATALQFFKSIHTSMTGSNAHAALRQARHESTEYDRVGAFLVATITMTYLGTEVVGT